MRCMEPAAEPVLDVVLFHDPLPTFDGPTPTDRPTPLQQEQARRAGASAREATLPREQNPYRAGDPRRVLWDGAW